MKKLILFMLICGVASLATAGLTISVNSDPNPVDSEITIAPSDFLVLDIHSNGDFAPTFLLVVDNAQGSIAGGIATGNSGDTIVDMNYYVPYFVYYAGLMPHYNGISWTLGGNFDSSLINGVVFDLIDFHCESPDDAIIMLFESPDMGATWGLADTVTIHQPEPMTMALLGLGGLFLRRKK